MATRVELPKDLCKTMIDQAIGLRDRQIKAASNALIKQALEDERRQLAEAKNTISDIK